MAFAYPLGDEFKVKSYDKNLVSQDIGITLIPEGTSSYSILVSGTPLAGSVFTRMFYLKGYGLRYFKPFSHETSVTGTDIYVYKMDWEGSSPNINPKLNIENGTESAG